MNDARHVEMTAEEYHAHPAVGSSMLEDFRTSRRLYYAKHIAKTEPQKKSDALDFGTLVHLMLLEPEKLPVLVAPPMPAVTPSGEPWNKRLKADREAWAAAEAERSCFPLCFSDEDLKRAKRTVDAVMGNWHARRLVEQKGEREYSIFWTDPATGIECKCRVDWWSAIPLDIKTTCDATPAFYAKQCVKFGYTRKRAHYLDGIRYLTGDKNPAFVHLAVETDGFHRVLCSELDDLDRDGHSLGETQRRSLLWELAKCIETGDWREPWERNVITLGLPGWAYSEDAFNYSGVSE